MGFRKFYIRAFTLQLIIIIAAATVITKPRKTSIQYKNGLISMHEIYQILTKLVKYLRTILIKITLMKNINLLFIVKLAHIKIFNNNIILYYPKN